MIKAVIFDADGMVVTGLRFSERLTRDYGISAERTADFFKNVFPACVVGEADLKEVINPYLKEWGWKGTSEELFQFWFGGEHKVDERFIAPINNLRRAGIKCYLATNQEKYRIDYFANDMGLGKLFDGIIASNATGFKKPQREFFDYVREVSGFKPDEILYWDDRPDNIAAAAGFGFEAKLYDSFETFSKVISQLI